MYRCLTTRFSLFTFLNNVLVLVMVHLKKPIFFLLQIYLLLSFSFRNCFFTFQENECQKSITTIWFRIISLFSFFFCFFCFQQNFAWNQVQTFKIFASTFKKNLYSFILFLFLTHFHFLEKYV